MPDDRVGERRAIAAELRTSGGLITMVPKGDACDCNRSDRVHHLRASDDWSVYLGKRALPGK